MHDCVLLYAFIAPALIRLQFYYFFRVATLSLNIFLKLAYNWIPCCVGPKPVILRTGKAKPYM